MRTELPWPNLFVPGAGKSATTSLHLYLNQHPDIWMSKDKEPVFFNNLGRYQSKKSRKFYLSLFEKGKDKQYRGESSTDYMYSELAIKHIKETVRDPKFIFILRNPIDRAISHYNWLKGIGFEKRPFREAFICSLEEYEKGQIIHPSYYSHGLYYNWINKYLEIFGANNIHLILSENLRLKALDTLNSCFTFLGLFPLDHIDYQYENESKTLKSPAFYRKMTVLMSEQGESKYKDFYRKVVPDYIRIFLRKQVSNGLSFYKAHIASRAQVPNFDQSLRVWVKSFYSQDVSELRKLTDIDIFLWEEFTLD